MNKLAVPLLFMVMVALWGAFPSAMHGDVYQLNETQAEDVYSQALNDYSEGNVDQALQLLKSLLANGYTDRYVYYSILDVYSQKISQMQGETGEKAYFETITAAKKTAGEGLVFYPDDRKILYRYSDFSRSAGDTKEFYQSLQAILKIDEMDIFANYWMGAYHFLNKDYDKAVPYFQKVIAISQSSQEFEMMAIYRSYFNLGLIAASGQNYRLAVHYFEKARSIYNKDFELIRTIAFTYAEMLEPEKAIDNFIQIPEMFRNEEIASVYAGVLFYKNDPRLNNVVHEYENDSPFIKAIHDYKTGDYTNSLKVLDEHILKNKFADFYSHYLLYQDYQALGDREKAGQQAFLIANRAREVGKVDVAVRFYKVVEENTNSIPEIYWLIGSLYDDNENNKDAVAYYEKYLAYPGSSGYRVPALVRLSYLYYKNKDKKKSLSAINQAKKIAVKKSELFQVYFYSGLMNLEVKNDKNAIRDFNEAMKADKKDARLYYFLATAYYNTKEIKKGVASLETARSFEKNSPEINNLLAYFYSLEKVNLDKALELVQLALIASPDNLAYLDTQGWIYFQKNDWDKAFEIFSGIIPLLDKKYESEDGFDEIYYHLGMIYEKSGKKEEAKRYYQKGYRLNPRNDLLKAKVR